MRAPRPVIRESRSAGFVLVGVLMFILVLTILGLTLFSLSSLESQFFYRSNDEQTARYAALSGIERAKFVLSAKDSLGPVRNIDGVPIEGLEYTVAIQDTGFGRVDSIGPVHWNSGATVRIRSLAVVNSERSLIEAQFTPKEKNPAYGRLFTLSDPARGLNVNQYSNPGVSASAQVFLAGGGLTQRASAVSLPADIGSPPSPIVTGADVTAPDIGAYFGKHWATADTMPPNCDDNYSLDASAATDQVRFYKTPSSVSPDPSWSLNTINFTCSNTVTITVRGTCIWMFDRGARFYKPVQIIGGGTANDALVLVGDVSLATGQDAGQGITFRGGISNPSNVPIVIVSSGEVDLWQYQSLGSSTILSYLSVFAPNCDLVGPQPPGNKMTLTHKSGAPQDQPGGVIGRLVEKGYLPNTTVSTGDFAPIAGTWREIKSSDGAY